jgi:hypothetical protein
VYTISSFSEKVNMALQGLLRASALANSSSFRKVKTLEKGTLCRFCFPESGSSCNEIGKRGEISKPDFETFKNAVLSSYVRYVLEPIYLYKVIKCNMP